MKNLTFLAVVTFASIVLVAMSYSKGSTESNTELKRFIAYWDSIHSSLDYATLAELKASGALKSSAEFNAEFLDILKRNGLVLDDWVAVDSLNKDMLTLGTVSFVTDSVWKVGMQEWSDVVQATGCNKKNFWGGYYNDTSDFAYYADCRSNPGFKGDLFSWTAVVRYQDLLCPDGWRVPTVEDFVALDIALGGTGENRYFDDEFNEYAAYRFMNDKYRSLWNATSYRNFCYWDGTRTVAVSGAAYWSQSEHYNASLGFAFNFYLVNPWEAINPKGNFGKEYGVTLRCVRDF